MNLLEFSFCPILEFAKYTGKNNGIYWNSMNFYAGHPVNGVTNNSKMFQENCQNTFKKMLYGAMAYYIWHGRTWCFKPQKLRGQNRNHPDDIVKIIFVAGNYPFGCIIHTKQLIELDIDQYREYIYGMK